MLPARGRGGRLSGRGRVQYQSATAPARAMSVQAETAARLHSNRNTLYTCSINLVSSNKRHVTFSVVKEWFGHFIGQRFVSCSARVLAVGPVLWKTQAAAGQLLQLLKVSGWQASPVVKAGPPGATVQFSSPHPSTTCTALLSQPAGPPHQGWQGVVQQRTQNCGTRQDRRKAVTVRNQPSRQACTVPYRHSRPTGGATCTRQGRTGSRSAPGMAARAALASPINSVAIRNRCHHKIEY